VKEIMDINTIIKFLDDYLTRTGRTSLDPVEANGILAKAGILNDSKDSPGLPLRKLLRKGNLPHSFQSGGKGSAWTIPHSSKRTNVSSNYNAEKTRVKKAATVKPKDNVTATVDISKLKKQLENARHKYKPETVKYLLIAEAPPDSIDRFFYYDNVHQHDYLFLGVTQALYPDLKDKFLASGRSKEIKNSILLKLKADGFYLLDLSELPLSLLQDNLYSQLPTLTEKINLVANKHTKIILIKATVYDTAFQFLQQKGFANLVNVRITFPGQGGQLKFQTEFKQALKSIDYLQ